MVEKLESFLIETGYDSEVSVFMSRTGENV